MKHAFAPDGEAALAALAGERTLVGLDYDGTLAPIVPIPDQARTAAGVAEPLRRLDEVATVAIVSGRSVRDVTARLPYRPRHVVGNHGMEGLPGQEALVAQAGAHCRDWLAQLNAPPALQEAQTGIAVEDKGVSLSVHYRLARDRQRAELAIRERLATLSPAPRIIGGHFVFNLLPPESPDKLGALLRLVEMSGCTRVVFVGDDETDEIVFRGAPADWLTVRVGYVADSAARFFLNHQTDVPPFLLRLAAALGAP
ncbi:MAG: trehalose-phosphatase [Proteobacteria bacterium]|nr:trehalose-phosphatase [Pseudomonadota bacterium]